MIYPVILSGGVGKRLWPLSTIENPKQFHPLYSDKPMLIETALRVQSKEFATPLIVTNISHRDQILTMFREYKINLLNVILEPCRRNTAAAIAVAVQYIQSIDPTGIILILPSDHYIKEIDFFKNAIIQSQSACRGDFILTLGIRPQSPETEYGYIQAGATMTNELRNVRAFVEKPNLAFAKQYIDDENYFWNSGIFMASVTAFEQSFLSHARQIYDHAQQALTNAFKESTCIYLSENHFQLCSNISFDCAVMEKHKSIMVRPLDVEWSDLGSWKALDHLLEKR